MLYLLCIKITVKEVRIIEKNNKKKTARLIIILLLVLIKINYSGIVNVKAEGYDSKYDPRELGLMTSVKDQGELEVCWCFAGIAAVESYLKLKGYGEYDFSEEHVRWWATLRDGYGFKRESYEASSFGAIKNYLTSAGGLRLEEDIPYNDSKNAIIPNNMDIALPQIYVTDIVEISSDINEVKRGIVQSGGVVSSYRSNNNFIGKTTSNYYCNDENFVIDEQHAILIVGWDDNYSKDNFREENKPENNGAWLIKNSWGQYNNEGGYCWISYEDKTLLKGQENFYIGGITDINDSKRIYQHDEFGPTSYIYSLDNEIKKEKQEIECANVYDFKDGYDILEGIMFMTSSIGAKYKVLYSKMDNEEGFISKSTSINLAEGVVPHIGFITVPIDGVKVPEGKGYIILVIDNSINNYPAFIGAETLSENYIRRIDKGESYMIIENYAIDCFEYSQAGNEGNYTIKVIARNTEEKIVAQEVINKQKESLQNDKEMNKFNEEVKIKNYIKWKNIKITSKDILKFINIVVIVIIILKKIKRNYK